MENFSHPNKLFRPLLESLPGDPGPQSQTQVQVQCSTLDAQDNDTKKLN
jgi:hypothetical protein